MVFEYNGLFKYNCYYIKSSMEVLVLWRQKWVTLISNPHLLQSWWAEIPSHFPVGMASSSSWASLIRQGTFIWRQATRWSLATMELPNWQFRASVCLEPSALSTFSCMTARATSFSLTLLHLCSLGPNGKSRLLPMYFSPVFMPVPKQYLKSSDDQTTLNYSSPRSWEHLRIFFSLTSLTLHRQPWMMQL